MATLEDLKPTKRDVVVGVGSVAVYKLFVERWVRDMRGRVEAYFEGLEQKRAEREEKLRMAYAAEARKEMKELVKELIPHLYEVKEQTAKQGETNV